MNDWDIFFFYLAVYGVCLVLFLAGLILLTMLLVKRKRIRGALVVLGLSVLTAGGLTLFRFTHPTYYKYRDGWVMGNTVENVEKRYGAFDTGQYQSGKAGVVGYFIFRDDGPIMPDHLEHYYYMEYDESGVVVRVYAAVPKGA